MNQTVLESIFVVFAFINLCVTVFFLWKAKQQGTFKKALLGAVAGVGTAISMAVGGMVVVFISQFFVTYAIEIALGVVLGVATLAVPISTRLVQKV